MSERAQGQGSSGVGIGLGIAGGCAVGCVVMVLAVGGLAWWSLRGVTKQIEALQAQADKAEAAKQELRALDEAHPPQLPEDTSTAVLTDGDVDSYLAVRTTVDPLVAAIVENRERLQHVTEGFKPGEPPDLGKIFSVMREAQGAVGSEIDQRAALVQGAHDALAEARLGPTDFLRMIEIVEYRFLHRPEAAELVVPADRRWELRTQRERVDNLERVLGEPDASPVELRLWLEDEPPPGAPADELRQRVRKELAAAKGQLAALEQTAGDGMTLTAQTSAVLEARRAELEAHPLPELGPLLDALGVDHGWSAADDETDDETDDTGDDTTSASAESAGDAP